MSPNGDFIKTRLLGLYDVFREKCVFSRPESGRFKTVIGIDLGSSSVKAVQVAGGCDELTVLKAAHVNIRLNGGRDRGNATIEALTESLSGMELKKARIICVMNCPQTCVRTMRVPSMPPAELREAIQWEVKNYIPFPWEKAVWDYEVTAQTTEKGVKKWDIMVAASPQETIDRLLSLFSGMGIDVSCVIPVPVAFQNIVRRMKPSSPENLAIIECGASITEINIYQTGRLAFSRKLSGVGRDITESLMTTLVSDRGKIQLNFQQAEEIKCKYGITEEEKDQLIEENISTRQIFSLIRPRLEQLVGDIESSLDFYREESHGGAVDRILLFGGGAFLKGLTPFLSQQLGIKVELGQIMEKVNVPAEFNIKDPWFSGIFAPAIGAAGRVREPGSPSAKSVNLLPAEFKETARRMVEDLFLKVVIIVLLVAIGIFYAGMRVNASAIDRKLQTAQLEHQNLQSQMEKLREKAGISRLVYGHPAWEEVFKELSNILPSGMYLTELEMEDNRINLKGAIQQNGGQDMEVALSHFMLTMENSMFKNVQLIKTQKIDSFFMEFEISGDPE